MDDLDDTERAVLDHVTAHGEAHVSFLQELIRAKPVNPPGNEERAAAVIRPRLEALGFEIEEYTEVEGRPNLVARLPGGDGPTLLTNAHLDVVPVADRDQWPADPFAAEIVDGRLYGRGACDHKSPIAAMLGAVEAIQAADVTLGGDLVMIFDSNEERGGEHGMEYVVERADLDPDMGIYACTTSLTEESAAYFPTQGRDNVHRANYGNQVYRVEVTGKIVHPLTPDETESAGERLSRILADLQAYCDDVRSRDVPLVGRPDAYLTTFESDGWAGRASPKVAAHLHRYYAPSEDPDAVYREFEDWVAAVAEDAGIGPHVSVSLEQDMAAVEVPDDHPLVRSTSRAARHVRGQEPTVTGVPAQTGITWVVEALGIPMVLFGFGNVNFHHAEPEWIAPEDVVDTTQAYALTYLDLLGYDGRSGAAAGYDGSHRVVRTSAPSADG